MPRARSGYGNFSSLRRMLTLNTKRSAQDSGSLREDERNIIPSKSARAEQSQKTPISRSKLLDISNEMDQNCVDEPVADFTMDIPNMETSTTKTSPTIYHPDSNDPDKLGYEDDDIQEDKIDYLKQENMMNDVENPFWIDPPEQSNHEKEHEEDDGRFQCKKNFDDFNIATLINMEVARKYRVVVLLVPNTHNAAEVFYPGSSLTAKQAHVYISANAAMLNLNQKNMDLFLDVLKTLLPDNAVLPKRLTYMTTGQTDDDELINNDSYSNKQKSYFTFDCCPCGEEVYIGDKLNNQFCSICKMKRYTDESERTALQEVNYRSLTLLLLEALQTNWFYEVISRTKHAQQHDQGIFDVTQGPIARKHMQEMHEKYEQCKLKSPEVREVSLLLSAYYDGAPLYRSTTASVWPLVVSILNLPPPLRVARGKGLFTLTLYTHKKNTARESFATEQFVNELLYLMEGIVVKVKGQEYFIQARLIMHCYDSRGLEGILQLQGSNSYAGCSLCGLCEGWGKALLGATTYFDNRDLLPLKHLLRLFGQSLQCCPPNYIRDVNVVRQSFIHDNHDASAKIINTRKDINNLNPCAVNQRDDIIKYLHDEDSPPISYHKPPYDLWLFKERMYFHHLNYKPFREYQRMTEDEYRAYAEANSRNKKTIIKGVRGLWIFAALPYARIEENVSYDGFHVLMNVSSYTIRLLFDQRTIDLKTRQFCKNINCHPQIWLRTTTATKTTATATTAAATSKQITPSGPWVLGSSASSKSYAEILRNIEKHLTAMQIPPTYIDKYKLNNLIAKYKKMKGVETIALITSHMDWLCFVIEQEDENYPKEYLLYYSMLSALFAEVQSPVVIPTMVEKLYFKCVELVEVHGGMFPPSESLMVFHQLLDMVKFMAIGGPIRSWWSLPIERAMVGIKAFNPTGGISAYKTMVQRVFADEIACLVNTYSSKDKCLDSPHEYRQQTSRDVQYYNDLPFAILPNKEGGSFNLYYLSEFEREHFIQFLLDEMKLIWTEDTLAQRSPLYRLSRTYTYQKSAAKAIQTLTFFQWLGLMNRKLKQPGGLFDNIVKDESWEDQNRNEFKYILKTDTTILTYWAESPIRLHTYKKALIWGSQFVSRGTDYCEKAKHNEESERYGADSRRTPSNPHNKLSENYQKGHGSWCKVHIHSKDPKTTAAPQHYLVAQLNYFACISPEATETLLTDLPFASITARKPNKVYRKQYDDHSRTYYENLFHVLCLDHASLDFNVQYTALYNVYATPIALVAYDTSSNPYLSMKDFKMSEENSNSPTVKPHRLTMHALERQKECIHTLQECRTILHPYNNIHALKNVLVKARTLNNL